MTRKISTLLMLTIFALSLLSVPTFAAKAKVGSSAAVNELATAQAPKPAPVGGADDPYAYGAVAAGKPNSTVTQSLGYQAVNGIVDLGVTTQYDLPGNQSQMRQIAVGCAGNVHAVWADLQPSATRFIAVASFVPGGAITTGTGSAAGGGFPDLAVDGSGVGLAVWHRVAGGGTFAGIDFSCAAASYASSAVYPDSSPVFTGNNETSNYIWPRIAADRDGSGNWFAHVIAHESPVVATSDLTGIQSLIYWRSQNNSHQPVASATGAFIDSVSGLTGTVIAHPDQADQRVAIVYTKPRGNWVGAPDTIGINENIVYRESTNLGATWGPVQTIFDFPNTIDPMFDQPDAFERGYETSGLYAADGCLHVLFQSRWPSDTLGNSIYYYPSRLRHWDDCAEVATVVSEGVAVAASCLAQASTIGKVTLSECQGKLYAIFSKNLNETDDNNVEVYRDCSTGGWANYDLIIKASSTGGLTWGPDSNVTNTRAAGPTYNCAAGACRSEINLGSVEHVTDSLRVLYLEDRDAGSNVQTQGAATDNPVKALSIGCFNMVTFQNLTALPAEVRYPFRTAPAGIKDTAIVLTNFGNVVTAHTSAISYISGSGWLAFGGSQGPAPVGSVPVGSPNFENIGLRATGPATQGLYQATVTFTYDSGTKVINIPVDLYNFTSFFLPQDVDIRTSCNRIMVNQASEIADNVDGKRFSYFSDATDYMYDGFLILGNSATNLTYSTFGGAGSAGLPTVTNPYGFLYAASNTTYDSTFANYRYASGQGYNRDSTIQFRSDYYAPKNPSLCNFYVLVFTLKKGPNGPAGTINNLAVGYYADWDVPADSGSDNRGGFTAAKQMLFQHGYDATAPADNEVRFGALGGQVSGGDPIVGGFVVDNPTYIYPEVGWENDSLWNKIQALTVGTYTAPTAFSYPSGGYEDLSMALILAKGKTLNGATNDSLKYAVVVAGNQTAASIAAGLTTVTTSIDAGYQFICDNNLIVCNTCLCGDANGSGGFSISDAVFVIAHIFGGGPAPNPACLGDANGSGGISISDAVYLIAHIFGGGPAPHCP